MPDLQKAGNVGIIFQDRELVRSYLISTSEKKFTYGFQRHEQKITQVGLILKNNLS